MIQKFRTRFIALSTTALAIVLMTLIGGIVSISYFNATRQVNNVLQFLVDHDGQLDRASANRPTVKRQLGNQAAQEGLFQYRYFAVFYDAQGHITRVNSQHIATVTPQQISQLAHWARQRPNQRGHLYYRGTTYAYQLARRAHGTSAIIFLDKSVIMAATNDLFRLAAFLGLMSLILFTLILVAFSRRAIQPIIETEQRQKQFITNAGHELKTPLAIIAANNELAELMNGESEWTQSTKEQVSRLTRLINTLISLARFDERPAMTITTVDASATVQRAATSFKAMITQDQKHFHYQISPHLQVQADENYFYELCNILLDNATKYCDPKGQVHLTLRESRTNRAVVLEIGNTYAAGKDVDYSRFFDRFYRQDQSRHQQGQQRGFGIGLSMAQMIVKSFHGRINARYKNQMLYFTVRLKGRRQSK